MKWQRGWMAGLLVTAVALAAAPPILAAPKADPRLARRFAIEVRSAPIGDVLGQLTQALGVTLSVDPSLANQRVNLKAAETTVGDFLRASGHLLGAAWSASGEGEKSSYRLSPTGELEEAAARLSQQRRSQFIRRLREIAAAMGKQTGDRYASDLRRQIAETHPDLPSSALAEVTTDYLRQTLLLGPLQGTLPGQLLRDGLVAIPVSRLTGGQQQQFLRFAAAAFAGARGFPSDDSGITPQSAQTAITVLNQPQARLEYRLIYGDAWSDLMLIVRIGYPDHWATGTLTGLVATLPDARGLHPNPPGGEQSGELARRLAAPLTLSGQSTDQALLALAQAAGIRIASDAYARPAVYRPTPPLETLGGLTLREALDAVAEAYGCFWWAEDGWYLFRHRLWPEERRVAVPDSVLRRFATSAQRTSRLDGESMALLAEMDDEHLLTLNLAGYAQGRLNAPVKALDLNEIDTVQRALGFYAALAPAQQELAATTGLSLSDLPPALQRDYATLAYDYGFLINPAEAANLSIRVQPTFPSTAAQPGMPVDGMVAVRLGFASTFTRSTALALRVVTPLTPPTPDNPAATSPPGASPGH